MKTSADAIAGPGGAVPMHDLDLARLIHADREREIARDRRVRAWHEAQAANGEDAFVPPPVDQPARISHVLRLIPNLRRGS